MYEQIRKNKIRTAIIIIIFAAVVIAVASFAGYYFVGDFLTGALLGVGIGTVYILISMSSASGSMLRMTNARRIDKNSARNVDEQQVYNIVSQLAMMEQLPEPDVYIVKDQQPNAFAVGMSPKSASVAVTTGLMNRLNRAEMEGVIAHEIAHIKNYDSRLKSPPLHSVVFSSWLVTSYTVPACLAHEDADATMIQKEMLLWSAS